MASERDTSFSNGVPEGGLEETNSFVGLTTLPWAWKSPYAS